MKTLVFPARNQTDMFVYLSECNYKLGGFAGQKFEKFEDLKKLSIPSQAAYYFTISFLLKSKRTIVETV